MTKKKREFQWNSLNFCSFIANKPVRICLFCSFCLNIV